MRRAAIRNSPIETRVVILIACSPDVRDGPATSVERQRSSDTGNRRRDPRVEIAILRNKRATTTSPIRAANAATAAGIAALVSLTAGCHTEVEPADLIFRGGLVYTLDPDLPRAEAVAVRGERIIFVGGTDGVQAFVGRDTEVIELGEGMLLPGFHDTHVHPIAGGLETARCDLSPAETLGDLRTAVSACAATAEGEWLLGGGFLLPLFPDGAPSRALLDSLSPDRPAFLTSADGHSAWVNSLALARAGVTPETPDPPPDGVIVRTASGEPQGTLRERAMELVAAQIPPPSEAEIRAGLERGLAVARSMGITTLHEASADESFLRAYAAAEAEGLLTARVIAAIPVDVDRGAAQVSELEALRDRYRGPLLRPVAAKIFLDGVIEGGTAALLEPYTDHPGWSGELALPPDSLDAIVAALDRAGFKVHEHAIGDRAIRVALDAFEAQRARDGGAGPRHIMAHIQLFDPADLPRMAELGVVASFQPLWFYADSYITELTEPRIGPARSRWLYPARSLSATGARLAGGSDWPVSSMDPLLAIETAVTRRDPELEAGPSWLPEERLELEAAIRAYTVGGAVAGDLEEEVGTIEVGRLADLVVLDRDLFSRPPEAISDALVLVTVFEGRVIYRR
jgi:predicted amidohydrolase YtcJ